MLRVTGLFLSLFSEHFIEWIISDLDLFYIFMRGNKIKHFTMEVMILFYFFFSKEITCLILMINIKKFSHLLYNGQYALGIPARNKAEQL